MALHRPTAPCPVTLQTVARAPAVSSGRLGVRGGGPVTPPGRSEPCVNYYSASGWSGWRPGWPGRGRRRAPRAATSRPRTRTCSSRPRRRSSPGTRWRRRGVHGPAEVRGERPGLRHGDPDPGPAEARRDAPRLLPGARRLHHPGADGHPEVQELQPARFGRWRRGRPIARRRREEVDRQGAGGRRGRVAGLQDHHRRPGRRPVHLAEGQRLPVRRGRGHARLLRDRRSGSSRS